MMTAILAKSDAVSEDKGAGTIQRRSKGKKSEKQRPSIDQLDQIRGKFRM